MRIITVEEHFQHPEAVARFVELSGPPPGKPDAAFRGISCGLLAGQGLGGAADR